MAKGRRAKRSIASSSDMSEGASRRFFLSDPYSFRGKDSKVEDHVVGGIEFEEIRPAMGVTPDTHSVLDFELPQRPYLLNCRNRFLISCVFEKKTPGANLWSEMVPEDSKFVLIPQCYPAYLFESVNVLYNNTPCITHGFLDNGLGPFTSLAMAITHENSRHLFAPGIGDAYRWATLRSSKHWKRTARKEEDDKDNFYTTFAKHCFNGKNISSSFIPPLWPFTYSEFREERNDKFLPDLPKKITLRLTIRTNQTCLFALHPKIEAAGGVAAIDQTTNHFRIRIKEVVLLLAKPRLRNKYYKHLPKILSTFAYDEPVYKQFNFFNSSEKVGETFVMTGVKMPQFLMIQSLSHNFFVDTVKYAVGTGYFECLPLNFSKLKIQFDEKDLFSSQDMTIDQVESQKMKMEREWLLREQPFFNLKQIQQQDFECLTQLVEEGEEKKAVSMHHSLIFPLFVDQHRKIAVSPLDDNFSLPEVGDLSVTVQVAEGLNKAYLITLIYCGGEGKGVCIDPSKGTIVSPLATF